jgi:hypothetical protein
MGIGPRWDTIAGTDLAGSSAGQVQPRVQPTADNDFAAALGAYQNPNIDYATQAGQAYNTWLGGLGTFSGQHLQAQANYNTAMIQSASANNEGTFNMYDKQFEQFLFDQGVANGIYSQPGSTASSMGGMGSMLGSGIGALGSIGGALLGGGGGAAGGIGGALGGIGGALGSAGTAIGGTLAGAAGARGGVAAAEVLVGAAASAGAAFACWLAREVLPERWKEVREWLFTKAPDWFRRVYLYNARRFVARGLTEADKARIREVMEKCLK